MNYPKLLEPTATDTIATTDGRIEVPLVHLTFKRWAGKPIADTWGGKALVDYRDKPMFAELAIMHMAIDSGWQARWIETYGMRANKPFHFMDWAGRPLIQRPEARITDTRILELLDSVATYNDTYYGCWDVLMWKDERSIFVESKRSKADKIRKTQIQWMESAIATGLFADDFLIAQWDFAKL